ncbi:unnamed protein product [Fusarium graminearum]|nr:unnamed protein product [Fusarium graminearum]
MALASIPHSMREKMLRDEVAYTMTIKLCKSIEIVGMAKTAGFDGLFLECEHSSMDLESTSQLCVAALYCGISPIVRVPSKDPCFVSRVLDGGALGVVVPHIRSVQDAQDVVNAAKFQPIGFRSSTNGLPQHSFRSIPAKQSNPITNEATLVIPMIETLEALELVDEIAALPGVDSLLIGTNDLTAEMGIPGDYENPRVTEAYARTIAACQKHGKWLGVGGLHARLDLVEKFCKMGARWVMAATDGPLLMGAASKRATEMSALNESVKASQTNGAPAKITNGNGTKTVTNGITNGLKNGATNGVALQTKHNMTNDRRNRSEVSDSNPARASDHPSSSQAKNRVACQRCFRRKQKCDRIRPACTSCAAQGVECIARSQQFDFDSEETGLTPARVNGYVESLKRRVAELEQKVKAAEISHLQTRRSFNSDTALPINGKRRRSTEGYVPVVNAETDNTLPNGEDQSTVEDTMSAIGLLSNRAMAESRAHIGNEPHKLSMIESISAALAVDGQDPSKASASSSHHISLDDDRPIVLTPDLTSIYIQRFIDWIVWLPHIDESRLMEQYHAVVDSDGTDQPLLHRFNTYLAVAIGISMSAEKGRLTALATNLHSAAVKLLPSILHSQEPFDTLHSAGLHKTAIPQSGLGPDTAYRSDWVFWTVYLLDRSLASSMGRPFGITDEDISVSIPDVPIDNELELSATLVSDICGSRQTSPIFSYGNLCFWREFPPPTNDTVSPRGQLDCLDQLSCRAMILIVNPPSGTGTDSLLAFGESPEIKTDAINSCKSFIEKLYSKPTANTTAASFLDAYTILAAAVVYLCLVNSDGVSSAQGFAQTFEVVSKASVLLTQCSTRFIAISVFQQFLLSLSTKIMEGPASVQANIPARISGVYAARDPHPPSVFGSELRFFESSDQLISHLP